MTRCEKFTWNCVWWKKSRKLYCFMKCWGHKKNSAKWYGVGHFSVTQLSVGFCNNFFGRLCVSDIQRFSACFVCFFEYAWLIAGLKHEIHKHIRLPPARGFLCIAMCSGCINIQHKIIDLSPFVLKAFKIIFHGFHSNGTQMNISLK